MRIVILAPGSRGDVQPYVALGLGLKQAGHDVRVASDPALEGLVQGHGLEHFPLATHARAILQGEQSQTFLKDLARNRLSTVFKRRSLPKGAINPIFDSCWAASQGAGAIIGNSIAYPSEHIAERLGVPLAFAWYSPWNSPAFLRSFLPAWLPARDRAARLLWVIVQQFAWQLARREVNRWRKESLGLPPAPLLGPFRARYQRRIPVLYGFSSHVVPRPAYWPSWYHVTGYWFLDSPASWQPPPQLIEFLRNGPPPISVGFGSIPLSDAERLTTMIVDALQKTGQRGILLSGWGGLGQGDLGDDILLIDEVPHDWLFPRVAAAVHHGGTSTTAASLRAGIPTVVVPFILDHTFWATRLATLGIGPPPVHQERLTTDWLVAAIRLVTTNPNVRARAAQLGERIRQEDGVRCGVKLIEQYLQRTA